MHFNVSICLDKEANLLETYLTIPEKMAGDDAPPIDTLELTEGAVLMCAATAFKNVEIVAQKHKLSFNGYINNKLKVDRPILTNIKQ